MVSKKALRKKINGLGQRLEVLEHSSENGRRAQVALLRQGIGRIHSESSNGASNVTKIGRIFDALGKVEENLGVQFSTTDQLKLGLLRGKAIGTATITSHDVETSLSILKRYDMTAARNLERQFG